MTGILWRHDRAILVAATKAALSRWSDLLTLLLGVPLLLLIARAWVADLPADRTRLLGIAACFVLVFALARLAAARLEYHRSDGVLAAQALRRGEAARYRFFLIGTGLALGLTALLLVGAGGPLQWLIGGAVGMVAGILWVRLEARQRNGAPLRWLTGARLAHPLRLWAVAALGIAAAGALLALGIGIETPVLASLTLLTGIAAAAFFGPVDAERVRFMALVGHSSLATLHEHGRRLLAFFLPFVLVLVLSFDRLVAGIALGTGLLALIFVASRVLAYRAYRRQLADWIVTMMLAGVAAAAITLPPAAPCLALAALFWLSRRALRTTWLLA